MMSKLNENISTRRQAILAMHLNVIECTNT